LLVCIAVVLVIIQGILGGLRVTGGFTLSDDPSQTSPNLALAIVHGVVAQIFLGLIVAIAALTSTAWKTGRTVEHSSAQTDRKLTNTLVAMLLLQLILGATYRHLNAAPDVASTVLHSVLGLHILIALGLLVQGFIVGVRLCTTYKPSPILRRLGGGLLITLNAQVILGIVAALLVLSRQSPQPGDRIPPLEVIVTTAHQATGALLFALAILAALWTHRLVCQSIHADSRTAI
jgi:cytochrome c oxidase assembly protein subunit 15